MCAKSRKSAEKIDRPFDEDVVNRARVIAERYQVVLSHEEGHWFGRGLELPRTFGDGDTAEACIADTIEAMTVSVAYIMEQGHQPPIPDRDGKRTEQINIRLSADEKLRIEAIAKERGYQGVGDFMRSAVLANT